ncbi:MAG TPA: S8 family serine peptidase [Xanthomonadales bacterium]
MKIFTQKMKTVCAATLLALGLSAHASVAERYIVQYDSNGQGLKRGLDIKVEGNGWFAVELDDNGKRAISAKAGFRSIEVDQKRFPMSLYNDTAGDPNTTQVTPYGYFQSQADQLTLQPGQKVCVIDSGIAGADGETGGLNADFDWSVITGDYDSGTGDWFTDGGPHGTHVAGTIGAVDNGFGVIGMAPGVPMHIIKVFNDAGWGYSSDLAKAANLCGQANATIISMSLGGGGANSTEENAFNTFTANGGLVIAAAGNDGNNVRSYPAGYKSVMMVGAVDADNVIADFSQFPSNTVTIRGGKKPTNETHDGYGVEVSAGGVGTLSTVPSDVGTVSSLTVDSLAYAASSMENQGSVSGLTYSFGLGDAIDTLAKGKICVIERGVISFHDKVLNCEDSGGIGAIIYNNVAGMLYGTLGATNSTIIPTVGAAQEDGPALEAASTASIAIGPSDYDYFSGTSMATPTTSGVAALVWSNNPGCSNEQIRAALKATAEDQGAQGRDDYYGYGIIKAKAASDSLKSSCGGITPPSGEPTASFSFLCTALACNFDASASSDSDGTIVSYSWSFGDSTTGTGKTTNHAFASSGTYTVTLTVTDNVGNTGTASRNVTVTDGAVTIVLDGTRDGTGRSITLTWFGATGPNVDVYVNGNWNNSTANDGSVTYTVNKRATYTFKICETDSTTACSNDLTL